MYKLIYFFGPDGTGKTTHADLIAVCLRLMGFRVWRTSVKQHHTFSYLLLRIFSYGNSKKEVMRYYGFNRALMRRIRTPWKILEIISLFPAIFYRVVIPLLLGYIIVCDRYVLDTLAGLSYFLKDPKLLLGTTAKLLVRLIPKNALLFHLDSEPGIILKRKKNEPLTIYLIEYYRLAYEIMVKQLRAQGLTVVQINTTTFSVEETHRIVLRHLRSGIRHS